MTGNPAVEINVPTAVSVRKPWDYPLSVAPRRFTSQMSINHEEVREPYFDSAENSKPI